MAAAITREERDALLSDKPIPGRINEISMDLDLSLVRTVARLYEAALVASEAEVERLQEALRQIAEAHHMMIEPDLKAVARAALTGEKP